MANIDAIDRYIGATRFNLEDRVYQALYESHYFPPIRAVADHFGVSLGLRVCYSPSRKAEHVTIGSERWLVYDQYMGQTMNLLNRILFEAAGEMPGIAYFHKVLAERLVDCGALEEALFCARIYDSQRTQLQPKRVNETLRGLYTQVQEQFYLFHELGHRLFDVDAPELAHIREQVDQLIAQRSADSRQSDNADAVIDGFRRAPVEARHDQPLEELEREVREHFESDAGARYRTAYTEAFNHRHLREELFCDLFAADLTTSGYPDPAHARDVLRAIYAGFYHLQALAFVEKAFSDGSATPSGWVPHFTFIQVRSHCLRSHLILPIYIGLTQPDFSDAERVRAAGQEFLLQLMKDQKRYYEVIFDPALKVVAHLNQPGRLTGLARSTVAGLVADTPLADKQNTAIFQLALDMSARLLTGWPPKYRGAEAEMVATIATQLKSGQ